MLRNKVESSQIKSVGYDETLRFLEIEFNTGAVYVYKNVDQSKYDALLKAESVGKYFNAEIKKDSVNHPFIKVRPSDKQLETQRQCAFCVEWFDRGKLQPHTIFKNDREQTMYFCGNECAHYYQMGAEG